MDYFYTKFDVLIWENMWCSDLCECFCGCFQIQREESEKVAITIAEPEV